ncbi:MAG: DNA topoisomerase IB [Planctomycetota bacterium]|nr:DNA topoisomerase IB [Planctomycetota bacterium]
MNGYSDLSYDSIRAAEEAGLYYTSQTEPGYIRKRKGKGFTYVNHTGHRISARKHLDRIESLHIPPAWEAVWICRDEKGHLQATGIDKKDRRQYLYHQLWSKLRNDAKFDRMLPFAAKLNAIRTRCEKDLRKRSLAKDKVIALVITLMDMSYIRIGNDEYARRNNSYGLTTLQDDHVTFENGHATFSFTAKSGKQRSIVFKDKRLSKLIRDCRDIPGADLFQYYDAKGQRHDIKSNHINEYLLEITGMPFTAKDFRTWGGTHLAGGCLASLEPDPNEKKRKRQVAKMVKEVSLALGNTPAVCRSSYIHPRLIQDFFDETFHEQWDNALKKAAKSRAKLNPDEKVVMCYLKQ